MARSCGQGLPAVSARGPELARARGPASVPLPALAPVLAWAQGPGLRRAAVRGGDKRASEWSVTRPPPHRDLHMSTFAKKGREGYDRSHREFPRRVAPFRETPCGRRSLDRPRSRRAADGGVTADLGNGCQQRLRHSREHAAVQQLQPALGERRRLRRLPRPNARRPAGGRADHWRVLARHGDAGSGRRHRRAEPARAAAEQHGRDLQRVPRLREDRPLVASRGHARPIPAGVAGDRPDHWGDRDAGRNRRDLCHARRRRGCDGHVEPARDRRLSAVPGSFRGGRRRGGRAV